MERQALPDGGVRYSTERGSLELWTAAPILAMRMTGVGEADYVRPIVDAFDSLRKGDRSVFVFMEMGGMANYESALRTELTSHFLKHRAQLAALHVFTQSKLVAMGVSVANLALGGIITSHSSREKFITALAAAIQTNGAKGIKSTIYGA